MTYQKKIKDRIEERKFIEVCKSSVSMAQAAVNLNLHFNSFKKRALELGCYFPNQSGMGLKKISPKVPLEEIIIQGIHPHYQSFK